MFQYKNWTQDQLLIDAQADQPHQDYPRLTSGTSNMGH